MNLRCSINLVVKMSLFTVYAQLKDNVRFFRIGEAEIAQRHRILVDETLRNLDCDGDELDEESFINIGALRSHAWDIIHCGKWSEVRAEDKYLYSLATYLEVLGELREYLVNNSDAPEKRSRSLVEHCIESLDMGILLGQPVVSAPSKGEGVNVFCSGASCLSRFLSQILDPAETPEINISQPMDLHDEKIDIPVEDYSEHLLCRFKDHFYAPGKPLLIRKSLNQWPANEKWKDVSYFQKNFGYRTVPVEIGSQYTEGDWGQELMLFKDFIQNQFSAESSGPIQYLAQHDVFQQIPELKEDIGWPPFLDDLKIPRRDVEIKIWFGPRGTVSPLHFDKKENFLCQIIGWKRVILISPEDSPYVYPYDGEMMSNTSQLDLSRETIDREAFPLAEQARQFNVILGPGQMLFIPFGWWHHVSSLSPSVSVSFWWNK